MPRTQETAIPSLLSAVPVETEGKAQISSAKTLVAFWSQLKPSKPEDLLSGQRDPGPALV